MVYKGKKYNINKELWDINVFSETFLGQEEIMEDIQKYLNQEVEAVQNVDTKKVSVSVEKEEILNRLKINDIVVLSGNNADEKLIGIVTRVSKKRIDIDDEETEEQEYSYNFCNITLVGTFYKKLLNCKMKCNKKT